MLTVTDTGVGISPASHLFDRLFRVDASRVRGDDGGSGLGLFIVKRLAMLLGGRVTVQSQVGEGTTFTVRPPAPARACCRPSPCRPPSEARAAGGRRGGGGSGTGGCPDGAGRRARPHHLHPGDHRRHPGGGVPAAHRWDRAYAYVVRHDITGAGTLRVKRRAVLRTAGGVVIARVAPPAETGESGEYFASARIPVGPRDPRTTYVLGYVVQVTGADGARARAARSLRLRFVSAGAPGALGRARSAASRAASSASRRLRRLRPEYMPPTIATPMRVYGTPNRKRFSSRNSMKTIPPSRKMKPIA